eukprot:g3341.t1
MGAAASVRKKKVADEDFEWTFEDLDKDEEAYDEASKIDVESAMGKEYKRMIAYAASADTMKQREVAEYLANAAVRPSRQKDIVEMGGLKLLLPLTRSPDIEVKRLAAHALANISVHSENQIKIAEQDGIDMLVNMLIDVNATRAIKQQAAKAMANLAVNRDNKTKIREGGALAPLIALAGSPYADVQIEAIACLANLGVDDVNEELIGVGGGLEPIVEAALLTGKDNDELLAQIARALRNLSTHPHNNAKIREIGGIDALKKLSEHEHPRVKIQANRALKNFFDASTKLSAEDKPVTVEAHIVRTTSFDAIADGATNDSSKIGSVAGGNLAESLNLSNAEKKMLGISSAENDSTTTAFLSKHEKEFIGLNTTGTSTNEGATKRETKTKDEPLNSAIV